jgi:crotonyl-CoA carboxylase/reductase
MEGQLALDANDSLIRSNGPGKDLYQIGEIPPLGFVPPKMLAWTIRRERHGEPDQSFEIETVDTPSSTVMTS